MKKIPTLFERVYGNHKVIDIMNKVTPGLEWVLEGKGVATIKWDGSCCAIIDGELYKRYDAKKGKKAPEGAIPCCEPDPITGHHPHWVKCDRNNPADKWFWAAYDDYTYKEDGTYEAVGKHFQGNPYNFDHDYLVRHGVNIEDNFPRDFDGMREWLRNNRVEGIVFWKDNEPQCKIKRSDFGFKWPVANDAAIFGSDTLRCQ